MSRPLRIEFPGATYHVTSRGDRREEIFEDDDDARHFLAIVAQGLTRYGAQLLAYCLMGNHYHLVLNTPEAGLSLLMRHINGVYTQDFNRCHALVGHLFQGRFKAILVDSDSYLMQLCRYVELNPVRAGMVVQAADWEWSSYRAHTGLSPAPLWLELNELHGFVLGRPIECESDHALAALAYAELVASGPDQHLWDEALRQQIYLGDQDFIDEVQAHMEGKSTRAHEIPRSHRLKHISLADWLARTQSREQALWMAHTQSGMSLTAMAAELGLSVSRVSQLVKRAESKTGEELSNEISRKQVPQKDTRQ